MGMTSPCFKSLLIQSTSKINTFMQILLVLVVVFAQIFQQVPESAITVLVGIVAGTTIASGIDYVVEWGRRAREHVTK